MSGFTYPAPGVKRDAVGSGFSSVGGALRGNKGGVLPGSIASGDRGA